MSRSISVPFSLEDARSLDRLAVEASSALGRRVTPAQLVSALARAQLHRIQRMEPTELAAELGYGDSDASAGLGDDNARARVAAVISLLTQ